MLQVETTLGDLGRRCNNRIVERKANNLLAMDGTIKATGVASLPV